MGRVLFWGLCLCSAVQAALPRPSDQWHFDCTCAPEEALPRFTSVQQPQRLAILNARFLAGVPGACNQGLWCLPGACATLASAVIVPASDDFTFSFFAGFPDPPKGSQTLFRNPKMSVAVTADGRFSVKLGADDLMGGSGLADGRWHHFAVTRHAATLALWLDGTEVASRQGVRATVYDDLRTQWVMLDTNNANRCFLDEVTVWPQCFGAREIAEIRAMAKGLGSKPVLTAEQECQAVRAHAAINPEFAGPDDYTPLRIEPKGLRPFAEQHDVNAVAIPWGDPAGRDLVCEGSIFGAAPLLYRFLRLEKGVPVYAEPRPWTGPDPRSAFPWRGTPGVAAFAVPHEFTDGGRRKRHGLLLLCGDPKTGTFEGGRILNGTDGKPFEYAGGHLSFSDMDGDGVDDLVMTVVVTGDGNPNAGFPWEGGSPWTENETPYAGCGRGYDAFGRWMGSEVVAEVRWAKGRIGEDGLPEFEPARAVRMEMPDYPGTVRNFTWKTYMGIMGAAAVETSAGRELVVYGDMMRLASMPLRTVGGDVYCGDPRPLLAAGYDAPHGYWIHRLTPVDFDGDGRRELILDGNPGTVAVLKGDRAGEWSSNRAWIEGGAICGETLSSAARSDWDGDGFQDVILTDASGWMTFWGGTADPLVYRAPHPFTVNGRPFCLKGGMNGSLQGEVERVWGYVKVIAGYWGDRQAIITVDIRGDLLLHVRAPGDDPLALAPAEPFRRADGRPFKVAWRSRPDFVKTGFAGVPRPSLLIQDVEGDVAVAVPEKEGSPVLGDVRKLAYADGGKIRLCGKNGLWGRGHLALFDWDGDGDEDIVFGSNGSCQRFFAGERGWPPASSPFLLRNVGTRNHPRYAHAELITLARNGKRLRFGWHNTTPWVTDLDGDGDHDLIITAENGKAYAFHREELVSEATCVAGLKTDHLESPAHVGAHPVFSWRMESDRAGARQAAYRLQVSLDGRMVWDSGVRTGDASAGIPYAGPALVSARRYVWSVSVKDDRGVWSAPTRAEFSTGLLKPDDWAGARWIRPDAPGPHGLKAAAFRRAVVNVGEVREAWWATSAAGVFKVYVNGVEIAADDILKPGYVHPLKVRQACTYSLPAAFDRRSGATNVFAAVVSASWSRDRIACRERPKRAVDPDAPPAFLGQLILRWKDGGEMRVGTDRTWRAAEGVTKLVSAGIYEGEVCDARVDEAWLAAQTEPDWPLAEEGTFAGEVRNFRGPPVRLRETAIVPVAAKVAKGETGVVPGAHGTANVVRSYHADETMRLQPGEQLVLDFGQNASAVPEFTFEAARGTVVTIRHAEMLNEGNGLKSRGNDGPAGTPYLANLRSSRAGIRYVCQGGKCEPYRPGFTFFGYRYAGVTANAPLAIHRVRSRPVSSVADGQDTVTFETDNPRLNRLFENCRWGMYSNYLSVPTDCPQRDERVGWTADTQVFVPAAAYLADSYAFLAKWMADMRDAQRADGCFAQVAPGSWVRGAVTGWTDAGVIVPYLLWRRFGDLAVVRENARAMFAYRDYLAKRGDRDAQPYGDWLSYEYGADMPWLTPERERRELPRKRVLNASYRIWVGRMLAEMADAIGDAAQTEASHAFAARELEMFRKTCLQPDGCLLPACDGQCSMLFALYLDLLPNEAAKEATKAALRANFAAHGNCLQTGFLGTAILLDALAYGMKDTELAYTLLLQDRNPSWLYSVDQGATTIWERWNSYTKEFGFGPVAMNSFNHYAYGAVAGWMVRAMAGIRDDPSAPGFRRFILAPLCDPRVGRVTAAFDSQYGRIESAWRYTADGRWVWHFRVPANTIARVELPDRPPQNYGPGRYEITMRTRPH